MVCPSDVLPAPDPALEPATTHHERLDLCVFFRPDIVKISLDSETILLLREAAARVASENKIGEDTSGSAKSFLAGVNDVRPSGLNG